MDIPSLALRQLADYDRREPGLLFAADFLPMTLDEAYSLQFEVARLRQLRGERIAGYKVGCVSEIMQNQLGLDRPVFGHVFATEIHPSDAVLNARNFASLAIEGEFAIRIRTDVPDTSLLTRHPAGVVASVFPVIELHHYVTRNTPLTAQELIGNNAIHAGVVVPNDTGQDTLLDAPIAVFKNGIRLGKAIGSDLSGGPLASLVLLAEHLSRFQRFLRQDDLILTGSPLPLYPVSPGDRIEVASGNSNAVRAQIAE